MSSIFSSSMVYQKPSPSQASTFHGDLAELGRTGAAQGFSGVAAAYNIIQGIHSLKELSKSSQMHACAGARSFSASTFQIKMVGGSGAQALHYSVSWTGPKDPPTGGDYGGWVKCRDGRYQYLVDVGTEQHGYCAALGGAKYDKSCFYTSGNQSIELLPNGKWHVVGESEIHQAEVYCVSSSWANLYNPSSEINSDKWRKLSQQYAMMGVFVEKTSEYSLYFLPGAEAELLVSLCFRAVFSVGSRILVKEVIVASSKEVASRAAKKGGSWVYGAFKSEAKWARQLSERGWTAEQITEAVTRGKSYEAVNLVNKANSATRYVHPTTGQSVVIDDITKELLHVGKAGFKYE